jgi:hypothetical protein
VLFQITDGGYLYYHRHDPRRRLWTSYPLSPSPWAWLTLPPRLTSSTAVAASGDDGIRYTGNFGFVNNSTTGRLGYSADADRVNCNGFFRWDGVTLDGTITSAYVEMYAHANGTGTAQLKVYAVDEDDPDAPADAAGYDADNLTDAAVDWDGAWTANQWNQSPGLETVFQEITDAYDISNEAVMLQIKNDGVAAGYHYNAPRMYDYTDHSYSPKLTVGYSVGGGSAPPLAMYLQQRRWR